MSSVSLPKGGGAIRGIGEKFAANPVAGTASLAIPVPISPGRSGFGPSLSLSYDSGAGNGIFGFGWSLSIPSITRKTDKGIPLYLDEEESDTFILSGSEDLIPVIIKVGGQWQLDTSLRTVNDVEYHIKRYRPRIEGLFARIERWKNRATGDTHWRSISKDNVTTIYGKTAESRIADPENPSHVFSWLICESYDSKGNAILYEYVAEDSNGVDLSFAHEKNRTEKSRSANRYLKKIKYGNRISHLVQSDLSKVSWMFEVVFDYGEHDLDKPTAERSRTWLCRHDPFSSYRAGFELRTYRLCQRILMFHHFPNEHEVGKDCLVRSTNILYRNIRNSTEDLNKGHPVASFVASVTQSGYKLRVDGSYSEKSLPPFEFQYRQAVINEEIQDIDAASLENLPYGMDGLHNWWVDLDGEGISGILSEQAEAWFYKANLGDGKFGPMMRVQSKPSLADLESGRQQLIDIAADGQLDLVNLSDPTPGFYERTNDQLWNRFIPFASMPNILWNNPNLRLVDLTGDGHADIMITEDEAITWYPSLAENGFRPPMRMPIPDDEERGPRLVFADITQSIYLADMSGDGLMDLVRIKNGEVCYWPNLGYGRFGAKVTMDNAPWFDVPDIFDQQRIRLADIDGSGVTDIIYLRTDGVDLYFNQSGNRWSNTHTITQFPKIDNLSSVAVIDLLGNGTACLVWSSTLPSAIHRPMRYIDLMGGQKPHLMTVYTNGMGKEVHLDYMPSTFYYLADKKAGKPWVTRIPFNVQCISKVTVKDNVRETMFVTSFTYHHGYYDGIEREFRGFGRVDQLDTETYSHFKLNNSSNVVEEVLHQPPVLIKTWFHTGALLEDGQLLHAPFRDEYYKNEDGPEDKLLEGPLPADITGPEYREAFRASKGLMLRQEVYAVDGTDKEKHPYVTKKNSYLIQMVQPKIKNRHASFLITSREAIACYYERNPDDPRVSHTFILETDEFGLVKKSATVSYPRRKQDNSLPVNIQAAQSKISVVYTETDYTNNIDLEDTNLLRVACGGRTYELTGVESTSANTFLSIKDIEQAVSSATLIPFEITTSSGLKKRLIAQTRTVFLKNDLSGPLPFGTIESLGIAYQSYHLAYTDGLAAEHYSSNVTDALFAQAGYIHSEGDLNWWIPSGIAIYPPDARDRFYLPSGLRDPLGGITTMQHDVYDLLLEQMTDAIGNKVSAKNDYRTLAPWQVIDANLNRSAVETDELGIVVEAAMMGKAGVGEGDTLNDPTTRIEYDLFNWKNNGKPNYVHTFSREHHGSVNLRWQEQYLYSDGNGNPIMTKVQAEPGKAKRWNKATHQIEEIDTTPAVRWVGNGRTVLNNKGNPVKQYEPYFSVTHEFEDDRELVEIGATPVIYYDPLGRNIRLDLPDGTFIRVKFDAWHQKRYDANDTVLESKWYDERGAPSLQDPEPTEPERRAAWLAAKHADSPAVIHTDGLGRTIYGVIDNGSKGKYAARTETDLTGHFAKVYDPRNRLVTNTVANLVGMPIYSDSAEKGELWIFTDIFGNPVKIWDNLQRVFRTTYDLIHRPISALYQEGSNTEIVFNHIVYGEDHPNATDRNLRGKAYQVYDQAGAVSLLRFDFKGNLVEVERRFTRDYRQAVDWSFIQNLTSVAEIQAAVEPLLENETFTSTSSYDALSRPVHVRLPDQTVMEPHFNEANYLESLSAQLRGQGDFITFLESQDYDAKGQRQFARYGNNTISKYFYDTRMFRLINILTKREIDSDDNSLQNLKYTYDPVGNITQMTDEAQQTHFFRNSVVKPEGRFEYDAIYQLIKATGREHAGIMGDIQRDHNDIPFISNLPHPNNSTAVRTYTEVYDYDELGNILRMQHIANGGSWTRRYHYTYQDSPLDRTNRLNATSLPSDSHSGTYSARYNYDAFGNMSSMPHLPSMGWNFMDQLKTVDLGGGGRAYYVYGNSGQRMRKVIERNGTTVIERLYLGTVEIYRKRQGDTLKLERWTVHIADDTGRIAQVDIKTADIDSTDSSVLNAPIIRFQYTNHAGSAVLETDENGNPISYEEYHPYGTTAYRSSKSNANISLKRYRYTGKEHDDETGLYYYGFRYYASWLGRWISPDPAGLLDGTNLYRFVRNNPIRFTDNSGFQSEETRSFGLPGWANESANPRAVARYVRGLGYEFSGTGAARLPAYQNGGWQFGTFSKIPEGDPLGILRAPLPNAPIDPVVPAADPGTNFSGQAANARQQYRAEARSSGNPMPQGTQVQHWTKERSAAATNMAPEIMNENLSPLQSRNNLPATLLLRDPNGGGTRYSVSGGSTYGNEHKFADRYLIPTEEARIRTANPNVDPRVAAVEAGRSARYIMEGEPGPAPGGGFGQNVRASEVLSRLPTQTRTQRFTENVRNFGRSITYTLSGANRFAEMGSVLARSFLPGFVEAEAAAMSAPYVVASLGITNATIVNTAAAMAAAPTAAATTIVASAVGGYVVGDIVESYVTGATGSRAAGVAAGTISGAATGAAIGAAIGSIVPGLGTAAGAIVGGAVGAVAGFIGSFW